MHETLITCEHVGKKFCRDFRRSLWYGVRDSAADLFRWNGRSSKVAAGSTRPAGLDMGGDSASADLRAEEFWANKDVSFELKRGECLGLVGRNGAGKTTLLKMLNGLIKPDSGRIEMRGRVGAMIALGAGFNPILTGRENIFVNGSILGMSRVQIQDKLDEIIAFAEIEEFIDAPVRTYSSGMQVRLGFSVACVLIEPDVLILDEVLAVGDAAFRAKCYNAVGTLVKNAAVILVSHNMESVRRICNRGLYLERGIVAASGAPQETFDAYEFSSAETPGGAESFEQCSPPLSSFTVHTTAIPEADSSDIHVEVRTTVEQDFSGFLRVQLFDNTGQFCFESRTDEPLAVDFKKGVSRYLFCTGPIPISPGQYRVSLLIVDKTMVGTVAWSYQRSTFEVRSPIHAKSALVLPLKQLHAAD